MRSELLSADAYLLNTKCAESALCFYQANNNVFKDLENILKNIGRSAILSFDMGMNKKKTEQLLNDFSEIAEHPNFGLSHEGRILAFAIPRHIIDNRETNFVYVSRPGGKPVTNSLICKIFGFTCPSSKDIEILQEGKMMVDGTLANPSQMIESTFSFSAIYPDTVRILASHLRPEYGIRSYLLADEPTSYSEEYKNAVQKHGDKIAAFVDGIVKHCQEVVKTRDVPECSRLLGESRSSP